MNPHRLEILKLASRKDISRMSVEDIRKELKIDHPYKVKYHLDKLREMGLIYYDPKGKKQKTAGGKGFAVDNLLSIPIVGAANCGIAQIFPQDRVEGHLRVSKRLVEFSKPENLMVLRAVGDSLNQANIKGDRVENGDYVIVDRGRAPVNGDYVLSIIDGAANFKRFYKDNASKVIRLVSESTLGTPPIILHEDDLEISGYAVNGVAVRVIKN